MIHDMQKALGVSALAAILWAASPPLAAQDFPRQPDDPASIAHGKQTFSVNCAFCHGSDGRGGEGGGPNLLRSAIVLADRKGEILSAIVLNGRVDKGMPKFSLPENDVADLAAYLHSLNVGRGAGEQFDPKRVLVGTPAAGRAFFNGKGRCSQCHSVTQDLAAIGSKYDAKTLQDKIFTGGGTGMLGVPLPTAPARTATVTLAAGEVITGRLVSIDDFVVVLIDANGNRRTIRREGDVPQVRITNPLQAHVDMVVGWEDRDLHDLTAYLSTIK
jgi:cytochrome c oxidase cbb3-type subunit III